MQTLSTLNMATPQPLVLVHMSSPPRPRQQKTPAIFQCAHCPSRFTRAFNLRSHIRAHTGDRPYSCSRCDKSFTRQHDRAEHEKLHSGEKPFACGGDLEDDNSTRHGCGRRFARRAQLTRHISSCPQSTTRNAAAEQKRQQRTTAAMKATPEPAVAPPVSQSLTHPAPLFDDYLSSNDIALLFPHTPGIRRPSPPPPTEPVTALTAAMEATPEPVIAPPISKSPTHAAPLFNYHPLPFPKHPMGSYRPHPVPSQEQSTSPSHLQPWQRIKQLEYVIRIIGESLALFSTCPSNTSCRNSGALTDLVRAGFNVDAELRPMMQQLVSQ